VIRVNCPACGRAFEFADFLGGLTVVCKHCSHPIPVPATRPNVPPPGDAIRAAPGALPPPPGPPLRQAPPADAVQPAAGVRPPPPPASVPALPEADPTGDRPSDSGPVPDWAIQHARTALRMDISAPDIQQRLIERGLTPATAAAAVKLVLEDLVRRQSEARQRAERRLRLHRILSGVVACACLVLAFEFNGILSVAWTVSYMVLPLGFIWSGGKVPIRFGRFELTPPVTVLMIRLVGWLALLALLFYRLSRFLTGV
jgi:hypothetical protein